MLVLSSDITIKGSETWRFTALASCVITEATDTLTDTCVIELPKKIKWEGAPVGGGDNPPIKRGDKITVKLGYDGNPKLRFNGFIRRVSAKTPVKIECEDGMFLLKQFALKKTGFKSITLDKLITHILSGTGIKHKLIDDDILLGSYRITKDTIAEELNELKSEYGLMAYFRNYNGEPVLYAGFSYPFDNRVTGNFIHGKNIISEELEYRRKEDIKLRVKAISIGKDNKRIEYETGEKDGELITVYHYGLDKDGLKLFAEKSLEKYRYTGFQGNFESFGEPIVTKTDIAHIEINDGNKGDYLIKKVEINFGTNGYRQKIEIGPVVAL
jgi:hypothetical protein